MSTTMYTLTETRETIPEPWQLFRGAYVQGIALDYVMGTCFPKLLPSGLVTSIADPYTIKFDGDMVDWCIQNQKDSHFDLDYLCSTNRNELERGKKQLRNFIYRNFPVSRYFSFSGYIAPVELSIEGSPRTYKITMSGPSQTGSEKRGKTDPSEIIIVDDGSPDRNPSRAELYQWYEDKDAIKDDSPFTQLYVNKGTLPREEALQDAEILIRGVYLSYENAMDSHWDKIYEVCLRLEGCQRAPGEAPGAVYRLSLHDEGMTSLLPIIAEMSRFDKQLNAEMSAQKPGWMAETIQREMLGRI